MCLEFSRVENPLLQQAYDVVRYHHHHNHDRHHHRNGNEHRDHHDADAPRA